MNYHWKDSHIPPPPFSSSTTFDESHKREGLKDMAITGGAAGVTPLSRVHFQYQIPFYTIKFIVGALTFVAALAWNQAITASLKKTPLGQAGKWIYAMGISLIAIAFIALALWITQPMQKRAGIDFADKLG